MISAEAQEIITLQQKEIDYIREVVRNYVQRYMTIERILYSVDPADREEAMQEMEIEVVECHNSLQAVLTLWEDTLPENLLNTLAGKSLSNLNLSVPSLLN